ncbi:MAG: carboxylating nicotinate-nucleotide diphosphorylase [Nitrososphaerota archaeon]|nr:carboxylating nicotinate-nucleotide diphosphorylase [Nitrososphaerota archaeon]
MPRQIVEQKLLNFLTDDLGQGDITATALIPPNLVATAHVIAKENGTLAGIEEATILAEALGLKTQTQTTDGQQIHQNQILLKLTGPAQTILVAERTLLNLLSRMSGIATQTHTLTQQLQTTLTITHNNNPNIRIAATRKSAPGLLYFDKKAVLIGGGDPHRLHLDDMVLIKDNHLALSGSVEEALKKAKTHTSFSKKIEIEVTTPEDALKAAEGGADIIMLDNFSPQQAKETAQTLRQAGHTKVLLEVSGGITPHNLLEYANADINIISIGGLTHSVKALDISLEIVKNV